MKKYPKWKYHSSTAFDENGEMKAKHKPKLVKSEAHEKHLGEDWKDHPIDPGGEPRYPHPLGGDDEEEFFDEADADDEGGAETPKKSKAKKAKQPS